jgi:hypothetical protein
VNAILRLPSVGGRHFVLLVATPEADAIGDVFTTIPQPELFRLVSEFEGFLRDHPAVESDLR